MDPVKQPIAKSTHSGIVCLEWFPSCSNRHASWLSAKSPLKATAGISVPLLWAVESRSATGTPPSSITVCGFRVFMKSPRSVQRALSTLPKATEYQEEIHTWRWLSQPHCSSFKLCFSFVWTALGDRLSRLISLSACPFSKAARNFVCDYESKTNDQQSHKRIFTEALSLCNRLALFNDFSPALGYQVEVT